MSNKMLTLVWDTSAAESTDLLMLVAIADQANDDGECWPAVGTLARKARLKSTRGAQKVLRRLVDLGEISIEERRIEGNKNKTNVYTINVPLLMDRVNAGTPYRVNASSGSGCPPVQGVGELACSPEPSIEPSSQPSLFAQVQKRQDKKPNEEKEMSNRQKHAISASMEKTAKKKLEELLGDKYPYARDLVNKHGSKAETVHSRLAGTPALLSAFLTLTDDTFADLIGRATSEAGKYVSGWQQNVGAQFFDLLGKRGAMHNSGNNTVASGLVDQDEEFPNPFDFHSFRHMDGLSEMKRAGNFVDTRRYYYRLKESGENPEREAEMKARLERDIAMYGPQAGARESNESISDQQE